MKKYAPLLLITVVPYVLPVFLAMMFFSDTVFATIMEEVFHNIIFIPLGLIVLFYLLCLIGVAIFAAVALARRFESKGIVRIGLLIKCLQIPAYIAAFVLAVLCLFTIFTVAFSVLLWVIDCLSIFLTGMIVTVGMIRAQEEGLVTKREAVAGSLLSFVFRIDLVAAIVIDRKVKKAAAQRAAMPRDAADAPI